MCINLATKYLAFVIENRSTAGSEIRNFHRIRSLRQERHLLEFHTVHGMTPIHHLIHLIHHIHHLSGTLSPSLRRRKQKNLVKKKRIPIFYIPTNTTGHHVQPNQMIKHKSLKRGGGGGGFILRTDKKCSHI